MIIDRPKEEREKNKFFKEYRLRWYKVFGKMTRKQENTLWDYWNERTSRT